MRLKIGSFAKPAVVLLSMMSLGLSTAAMAAEKFKVVTTFTIIADMAQNVAGDAAVVESITKPDAEIHNYQATPGDIRRAQGADLILYNGLNLELWFKKFFKNLHDVPSVIVTEGVQPMSIAQSTYSGKPNPHAWMSPSDALIYVDNIRDALVKYDSVNAKTYQKNAEAYKKQIMDMVQPIREKVAQIPEDKRWLVTSEGAFSYLARDFGLKELYLYQSMQTRKVRHNKLNALLMKFVQIRSLRYSVKARYRQSQHSRLRVKQGLNMQVSCTWIH